MKSSVTLAALVLSLPFHDPASAAFTSWYVPQDYVQHVGNPSRPGDPTYSGWTCGLGAHSDPLNQAVMRGTLAGGPFTVRYASQIVSDPIVSMTCTVQMNNNSYGSNGCYSNTSISSLGTVQQFSTDFTCTVNSTDSVYVCTEVSWQFGILFDTYQYDDDDNAANGNQCALALSAG